MATKADTKTKSKKKKNRKQHRSSATDGSFFLNKQTKRREGTDSLWCRVRDRPRDASQCALARGFPLVVVVYGRPRMCSPVFLDFRDTVPHMRYCWCLFEKKRGWISGEGRRTVAPCLCAATARTQRRGTTPRGVRGNLTPGTLFQPPIANVVPPSPPLSRALQSRTSHILFFFFCHRRCRLSGGGKKKRKENDRLGTAAGAVAPTICRADRGQ